MKNTPQDGKFYDFFKYLCARYTYNNGKKAVET